MFNKINIPYPLFKSGLVLSSLSLIFLFGFSSNIKANEHITVRELQSQVILNCRVYAKVQMLSLVDVSIKLDGTQSVIDQVENQNQSKLFKSNLKQQYKSIYKNCVRVNYNNINRVRIGNINQAYQKYKDNYEIHKGYINSFYYTINNEQLIKKYEKLF